MNGAHGLYATNYVTGDPRVRLRLCELIRSLGLRCKYSRSNSRQRMHPMINRGRVQADMMQQPNGVGMPHFALTMSWGCSQLARRHSLTLASAPAEASTPPARRARHTPRPPWPCSAASRAPSAARHSLRSTESYGA
jgi:hypothetical protein